MSKSELLDSLPPSAPKRSAHLSAQALLLGSVPQDATISAAHFHAAQPTGRKGAENVDRC